MRKLPSVYAAGAPWDQHPQGGEASLVGSLESQMFTLCSAWRMCYPCVIRLEIVEWGAQQTAMATPPNPLRVFHITAIPNLARIAGSGALLSKNRLLAAGQAHENIA